MASPAVEALAERIKELTPSDQLRFAAELLESVRDGIAEKSSLALVVAIGHRVADEAEVVLATSAKKGGG